MNEIIKDTLVLDAKLDKLSEVFTFVRQFYSSYGFNEKYCKQLDIVVEEVYVNIASYAYAGSETGDATIECSIDGDTGILVFKDHGTPYDPTLKEDPVLGDPKKMTIGGYGIYMVKQIMDDVSYRYDETEKENILTMRKNK